MGLCVRARARKCIYMRECETVAVMKMYTCIRAVFSIYFLHVLSGAEKKKKRKKEYLHIFQVHSPKLFLLRESKRRRTVIMLNALAYLRQINLLRIQVKPRTGFSTKLAVYEIQPYGKYMLYCTHTRARAHTQIQQQHLNDACGGEFSFSKKLADSVSFCVCMCAVAGNSPTKP